MATTPNIPTRELIPADRCDRCGARAAMRATKDTSASELLFCNHHGREASAGLSANGWVVDAPSNAMASV